MCSSAHRHPMTDDCGGVNIDLVFNDDASDTSHMGVNAVPVADAGIVSDNRIGLYHVVIAYFRIIADDRIGTDKVAFAQLGISINPGCVVNEFHKLATSGNNLLHARATRRTANRRDKNIIFNRTVILNSGDDGRVIRVSVQSVQIIINETLNVKGFSKSNAFQCIAVNRAAHATGTDDDEVFHPIIIHKKLIVQKILNSSFLDGLY